jgi:hypothetical protein
MVRRYLECQILSQSQPTVFSNGLGLVYFLLSNAIKAQESVRYTESEFLYTSRR